MGIGIRDETTQRYIFSEDVDRGHWYYDQDGLLYIIPAGDDESLGPDNAIMDSLNAAYRAHGFEHVDPDELATSLKLDFVSRALHRFDEESGYYTA